MEKVFESENLIYVKLDRSLVNDYLLMINNPEVANKLSDELRTFTLDDELKWIDTKLKYNSACFSIIEKNSNKFVGNIEIMDINNNIGELGITITPNMQDKHYGSESIKKLLKYARNNLGLHVIDLNVYNTNSKAIHCYEKIGFVQTGVGKTSKDIHMEIIL